MRIPDVEGLKDATEAVSVATITVAEATSNGSNGITGSVLLKSFGRASASLCAANGFSRLTPTDKQAEGLSERQSSCSDDKAFYRCQSGFIGCCSVNPCNPGSTCPDDQEASDASETRGAEATRSVRSSATERQTMSTDATTTTAGISTASPTGTRALMTTDETAEPTAWSAPECPGGDDRIFADGFKIRYRIHCATDNSYDSYDAVSVGTGGYDQCFSACSQSEDCAGFTYVGLDSGDCYLKSQMPNGTYVAKKGNIYISCSKVDPRESAGNNPNAVQDPPKRSTGAIIGGIVGGVAFLGLLLLCVALLAKRRRRRIEHRRATVTHVFHGAIEQDMTAPQQQGREHRGAHHQRQGSTSHDIFMPYGGNVYDPRTHTRQRSIYAAQQTWV